MSLIIKVNSEDLFIDLFKIYNRDDYFSYNGLKALYEYLDDVCYDCDFNINVNDLCHTLSEYQNWEEVYDDYKYCYNSDNLDYSQIDVEDFRQWINNSTIVIEFDEGIIIEKF